MDNIRVFVPSCFNDCSQLRGYINRHISTSAINGCMHRNVLVLCHMFKLIKKERKSESDYSWLFICVTVTMCGAKEVSLWALHPRLVRKCKFRQRSVNMHRLEATILV